MEKRVLVMLVAGLLLAFNSAALAADWLSAANVSISNTTNAGDTISDGVAREGAMGWVTLANVCNVGYTAGGCEVPDVYQIGTYVVSAGSSSEFVGSGLSVQTYWLSNTRMDSESYDLSSRLSATEGSWSDKQVNYVICSGNYNAYR